MTARVFLQLVSLLSSVRLFGQVQLASMPYY
jgi:hypothetical protein